jgi:nicotinamide-nucleotide amidase
MNTDLGAGQPCCDQDNSLPSLVLQLLVERQKTLAIAESCTGGLLSNRLTNVPGSSAAFLGALICYAPRLKEQHLRVPAALLETAIVSQAAAEQMALGIREYLGSDWGLGITGYAGPHKDVPAGEVGLVWLAVADENAVTSLCARYGETTPRPVIKFNATQAALDLLKLRLLAQNPGGGETGHGTLQQT